MRHLTEVTEESDTEVSTQNSAHTIGSGQTDFDHYVRTRETYLPMKSPVTSSSVIFSRVRLLPMGSRNLQNQLLLMEI